MPPFTIRSPSLVNYSPSAVQCIQCKYNFCQITSHLKLTGFILCCLLALMQWMKRSDFAYAVIHLRHILLPSMKPSSQMKLLIILNLLLEIFRMVPGMSVLIEMDQDIHELVKSFL